MSTIDSSGDEPVAPAGRTKVPAALRRKAQVPATPEVAPAGPARTTGPETGPVDPYRSVARVWPD